MLLKNTPAFPAAIAGSSDGFQHTKKKDMKQNLD